MKKYKYSMERRLKMSLSHLGKKHSKDHAKKIGKSHVTHGMSKSKPYNIFVSMKVRCEKKNHVSYPYYGGRGIKSEWKDFKSFWEDMKSGYQKGLSLDRIDNNGNYCKENCRWVTKKEQSRNRKSNISYKGELAQDASLRLGGSKSLISARLLSGWNIKKAFSTPPYSNRYY